MHTAALQIVHIQEFLSQAVNPYVDNFTNSHHFCNSILKKTLTRVKNFFTSRAAHRCANENLSR